MRSLILVMASAWLAACGGSSGSMDPADNANAESFERKLSGAWSMDCHQSVELGAQAELSAAYAQAGQVTFTYRNFTDSGCVEAGYTLEVVASYQTPGEQILASGQTVHLIQYSGHAVYMTLPDQGYADAYNSNSFCGKTDWAAGVKTSIGTCSPSSGVLFTRDILLIDGDRLYHGRPGASYPAELAADYFAR